MSARAPKSPADRCREEERLALGRKLCENASNEGKKPMSSMRSASSSTTVVMLSSGRCRCAGDRADRPGVATMMSVPRLNAAICGRSRRRRRRPRRERWCVWRRAVRCAVICSASSRVGARISACVFPRGKSISAKDRKTKGGRFAAAGGALARTSRPSSAGGIASYLDRGGFGEVQVAHRAQKLRLQAELVKI